MVSLNVNNPEYLKLTKNLVEFVISFQRLNKNNQNLFLM